jgi:hypothetical protein
VCCEGEKVLVKSEAERQGINKWACQEGGK